MVFSSRDHPHGAPDRPRGALRPRVVMGEERSRCHVLRNARSPPYHAGSSPGDGGRANVRLADRGDQQPEAASEGAQGAVRRRAEGAAHEARRPRRGRPASAGFAEQLAPGGQARAPAAAAPSTAPLGASGSSSNVPRACTSSFGRMLRKVSSFERKKPKPPSLSSGSQSARGRASSGALAGGAQCD